jgi:hypothetical protein
MNQMYFVLRLDFVSLVLLGETRCICLYFLLQYYFLIVLSRFYPAFISLLVFTSFRQFIS